MGLYQTIQLIEHYLHCHFKITKTFHKSFGAYLDYTKL